MSDFKCFVCGKRAEHHSYVGFGINKDPSFVSHSCSDHKHLARAALDGARAYAEATK